MHQVLQTMSYSMTVWYFALGPNGEASRVTKSFGDGVLTGDLSQAQIVAGLRPEWQCSPGCLVLTGVVLVLRDRKPWLAVSKKTVDHVLTPAGVLNVRSNDVWDACTVALLDATPADGNHAESRDAVAHVLLSRWFGHAEVGRLPIERSRLIGNRGDETVLSWDLSKIEEEGYDHVMFDLQRGGEIPPYRPIGKVEGLPTCRKGGVAVLLASSDAAYRERIVKIVADPAIVLAPGPEEETPTPALQTSVDSYAAKHRKRRAR
jgi:hypothetical protein